MVHKSRWANTVEPKPQIGQRHLDSNTIRTITVGYGISPYQSRQGVVDFTTGKELHLSS